MNPRIKPTGYLVASYYVSPDDTLADGQKPDVIVKSGYFKSLESALDFIENGFDGKETWNETYVPEIKEHFADCDDEYVVDDWSAGQWASIVPHFDKDVQYKF